MKKVTKNKTPEVKENLNIITVDDYPELAYKFIHHLYHTDKTVALIAGRDLVEYIFDEVMDLDETSIWRVDLTDDDPDIEYMLSVTDEGYVTVIPLDDYVQSEYGKRSSSYHDQGQSGWRYHLATRTSSDAG